MQEGGMPDMKGMDFGGMDFGDLGQMLEGLDPAALEEMANLGPQFDEIMKIMAEMSPEELQKQMEDAMQMMASEEMMENMMQNQDEVLASLEQMGQIDPEEMAKFKKDPEYFQQKMKEGVDQMRTMFEDPDMLKIATESMQGLTDLYNNPDQMVKMMEGIFEDFEDDDKIEEARQMLLTNPDLGHPSLSGLFDTEEMKDILSDPVKWRESVKEGQGLLAGAGAGVGEL
jgi:Asp-tRNA(Asn)/Glu-tRNA(Gln) amidotransferase C subunit